MLMEFTDYSAWLHRLSDNDECGEQFPRCGISKNGRVPVELKKTRPSWDSFMREIGQTAQLKNISPTRRVFGGRELDRMQHKKTRSAAR